MRRVIMRRRWRRRALYRPFLWRRRPWVRALSPLRWLFWIPLMGLGGLFFTLLLIFWR